VLAVFGPLGVVAACVMGKVVENAIKDSAHPSEARQTAAELLDAVEIITFAEEGDLLQCEPFRDMMSDDLKQWVEDRLAETSQTSAATADEPEHRYERRRLATDSPHDGSVSFSALWSARRRSHPHENVLYSILIVDGQLIVCRRISRKTCRGQSVLDGQPSLHRRIGDT
jgi:hypothetical protein